MIKTKPATVAGQRVLSFVQRIENLEEERKAIGGDVRDVYAEAKSAGYDVKTIRWLIQERKVDSADRDERDSLRDTYAHALGMAVSLVQVNGLSLREASRQSGVSKSSIHRALAVPAASQQTAPDVPGEGAATLPEIGSGSLANQSNAAPEGCVDGASAVSLPAEPIVPPCSTPQTDGATNAPVAPVPDEGVGAGTSFEAGNSAHEGERDGRNERNGEGRGSQGLQPERQSGRGGDQVRDGGLGGQDGEDPGPEQRAGGPRGGGGDHEHPDGQHVVRPGGDQGSIAAAGRGVDAPSTPLACRECGEPWHGGDCAPVPDAKPRALTPVELGAVAEPSAAQRVARPEQDQAVDLNNPVALDALRLSNPERFCALMAARDDAPPIPSFLRRQASR